MRSRLLTLVQRARPDWIVLAAAYTDVDGCETQSRPGFRCELPRRGQRGASRQAAWLPLAFSQHRLCLRWHQNDALRDRRSARRRAAFTGSRRPRRKMQLAEILSGVLHRPDFVAFWPGRKMLPRHNSEIGRDPARAGSSGRSARFSDLLHRSGPRHHSVVPPGSQRHRARHQPRGMLMVRVCPRNHRAGRPENSCARDHE